MTERKPSQVSILAQMILEEAVNIRSNDIHILPEEPFYKIYLRTSTGLHMIKQITEEEGQQVIAFFKYLADMDVGENRRPQSGSVKLFINESWRNLRLSTMTNLHALESLVIRILNPMNEIDLRTHSFFSEKINLLEKMVSLQSGLILFSGPVGSGKTTTMYQLIRQEISDSQKNVICIEDPVEIEEENFLQIQVNEQAGITYDSLLRQSLRHHPDIIVVGEIRDEETAQAVIRAALTGHLILATVHAKNAEGVISRVNDLGVPLSLLDQVLIGVVFQKMLPRFCHVCGEVSNLECVHFEKHNKQAVLFDIRHGETLRQMGKRKANKDFNYWLRKAVENGYITEKTHDQFLIPKTNSDQ